MGKIRVSTLGDSETEKKQKDEAYKRRLAKKVAKDGATPASEVKKQDKKDKKETKEVVKAEKTEKKAEAKKEPKKLPVKAKKTVAHVRSARYQGLRTLVDPKKLYTIDEAFTLVKQTSKTKFTGSVEAHFNLARVIKIKNVDGMKVERKSPLAHAKLGKTTDSEKALKEKLEQSIKLLGLPNIKKVVLNATMGPGIKVALVTN